MHTVKSELYWRFQMYKGFNMDYDDYRQYLIQKIEAQVGTLDSLRWSELTTLDMERLASAFHIPLQVDLVTAK